MAGHSVRGCADPGMTVGAASTSQACNSKSAVLLSVTLSVVSQRFLPPGGHLVIHEDLSCCYNQGGAARGIKWGRAQGCCLTSYSAQATPQQSYLAHHVSGVQVEKPCTRPRLRRCGGRWREAQIWVYTCGYNDCSEHLPCACTEVHRHDLSSMAQPGGHTVCWGEVSHCLLTPSPAHPRIMALPCGACVRMPWKACSSCCSTPSCLRGP